jgi:hypothetical protein
MNILPGAARAFFSHHHAVVVKLEGNADHLIALAMQ